MLLFDVLKVVYVGHEKDMNNFNERKIYIFRFIGQTILKTAQLFHTEFCMVVSAEDQKYSNLEHANSSLDG